MPRIPTIFPPLGSLWAPADFQNEYCTHHLSAARGNCDTDNSLLDDACAYVDVLAGPSVFASTETAPTMTHVACVRIGGGGVLIGPRSQFRSKVFLRSYEGERERAECSRGGGCRLIGFSRFHRVITTLRHRKCRNLSRAVKIDQTERERQERKEGMARSFQLPATCVPARRTCEQESRRYFYGPPSRSAGYPAIPPMPIALNALAIYRLGATTAAGG